MEKWSLINRMIYLQSENAPFWLLETNVFRLYESHISLMWQKIEIESWSIVQISLCQVRSLLILSVWSTETEILSQRNQASKANRRIMQALILHSHHISEVSWVCLIPQKTQQKTSLCLLLSLSTKDMSWVTMITWSERQRFLLLIDPDSWSYGKPNTALYSWFSLPGPASVPGTETHSHQTRLPRHKTRQLLKYSASVCVSKLVSLFWHGDYFVKSPIS